MRHRWIVTLVVFTATACLAPKVSPDDAVPLASTPTAEHRSPQSQGPRFGFEPNWGQAGDEARFVSQGPGRRVSFCEEGVTMRDASGTVKVRFVDAGRPVLSGEGRLPGTSNYLLANDTAGFLTSIPTYAQIRMANLYAGIDAVFYSNERGELEYDLVVAPGADPGVIRIAIDGVEDVRVEADGSVTASDASLSLLHEKALAYQGPPEARERVDVSYRVEDGLIAFRTAGYDRSRPLVIDPVLLTSSYLGGSGFDEGAAVAVDDAGRIYIAGRTSSSDFRGVVDGPFDAFVVKLAADGSTVLYSTYLGGTGVDYGYGIAVDANGEAVVVGSTDSIDFPVVGAAQPSYAGSGQFGTVGDAFVTRLDTNGSSIVSSTYLGGERDDEARAVALDDAGNVYVTGWTMSTEFPVVNALQSSIGSGFPDGDAFVAKLTPSGSSLAYATYLGGDARDQGLGIAVDDDGSAHVTGLALSSDFPTQGPLADESSGTGFVAKLAASGGSLDYGSRFGGSSVTYANAIALDSMGAAYVAGSTESTDFPAMGGAQPTLADDSDAFVIKVAPDGGALEYGTYLGGTNPDEALGVAVDAAGSAFVVGVTQSFDFPTFLAPQPNLHVGPFLVDSFITKLSPDGKALLGSTFHGGSDSDSATAVAIVPSGAAVVVGTTSSEDLPLLEPLQGSFRGLVDVFVTRIEFGGTEGFDALTVSPSTIGSTGEATLVIEGSNLVPGTKAALQRAGYSGFSSITEVGGAGTLMAARFSLVGAALGKWDLVITHPQGAEVVLPGAVTVEPRSLPNLWPQIIGPDKVLLNRPTIYDIVIGNNGNVDAIMVPVWIVVPKHVEVELVNPPLEIERPEEIDPSDWDSLPTEIDRGSDVLLGYVIPRVAAGQTGRIRVEVTATSEGEAPFSVTMGNPMVDLDPDLADKLGGCALSLLSTAATVTSIGLDLLPGARCAEAAAVYAAGLSINGNSSMLAGVMQQDFPVLTIAQVGTSTFGVYYSCAVPGSQVVSLVADGITLALGVIDLVGACGGISISKILAVLASLDPNEKVGFSGVGDERFIGDFDPLSYEILFENLPSATASAQTVVITDEIDPALDIDSIMLGPVAVGDEELRPPLGRLEGSWTGYLDLVIEAGIVVRVDVALDKATRTLTWTFSAIDHNTGEPTTDPLEGFLPPNTSPPEGQGRVSFSARRMSNVGSLDSVRNRASIVFDLNPAILTNEILVTFDLTPPTSSFVGMGTKSDASTFEVSWEGADGESGILNYTVLVAEGDEQPVVWLENIEETSAMFEGEPGRRYTFELVARDRVSNMQLPAAVQTVDVASDPPGCGCHLANRKSGSSEPAGPGLLIVVISLLLRRRVARRARL